MERLSFPMPSRPPACTQLLPQPERDNGMMMWKWHQTHVHIHKSICVDTIAFVPESSGSAAIALVPILESHSVFPIRATQIQIQPKSSAYLYLQFSIKLNIVLVRIHTRRHPDTLFNSQIRIHSFVNLLWCCRSRSFNSNISLFPNTDLPKFPTYSVPFSKEKQKIGKTKQESIFFLRPRPHARHIWSFVITKLYYFLWQVRVPPLSK